MNLKHTSTYDFRVLSCIVSTCIPVMYRGACMKYLWCIRISRDVECYNSFMRIHMECRRLSRVTDPIQTSANKSDTLNSCSHIFCFCLGFSSDAKGVRLLAPMSSNRLEMLKIFEVTAWAISIQSPTFPGKHTMELRSESDQTLI